MSLGDHCEIGPLIGNEKVLFLACSAQGYVGFAGTNAFCWLVGASWVALLSQALTWDIKL